MLTKTSPENETLGISVSENLIDEPIHFLEVEYFEPGNFYRGINTTGVGETAQQSKMQGGIVPHHLLASRLLSDFFSRLNQQYPESIVLLGPNHHHAGKGKILTTTRGWETPFGQIHSNTQITQKLIAGSIVQEDNYTLQKEHSIAGMMPYLKYYLPETKVVPIILMSSLDNQDAKDLGILLASEILNENVVLVASVDFSHYLNAEESLINDTLTEQLIKEFDTESLFNLDNSYLDSAPSISVLLNAMRELKATDLEIIDHTNSALLLGGHPQQVTSYFEMTFTVP